MIDEKQAHEEVRNLTDTLLRLERYLKSHAQHQVYCGKINIWQDEVRDALTEMSNKIQAILKKL
jgi:hypothetical protein